MYRPSECEDPSPVNGYASLPRGKTYGEVAYISCNVDYALVGEKYITCVEGPEWNFNTTCVRGKWHLEYQFVPLTVFTKQ